MGIHNRHFRDGPATAIDAEKAVLGAMILGRFADAVNALSALDFGSRPCRSLFEMMIAMHREGIVMDEVTVQQNCVSRYGVSPEPDQASVRLAGECIEACPSAANVEAYIREVKKASLLRQIEANADEQRQDARDVDLTTDEIISRALERNTKLCQGYITGGFEQVRGKTRILMQDIASVRNGEKVETILKTGYADLDFMLGGGLKTSKLMILAARPGMGKTTLALNIAVNASVHWGLPVGIVSLEMEASDLLEIAIAQLAGVNAMDFRDPTLPEESKIAVHEAALQISDSPLYIDQSPDASIVQIEARIQAMAAMQVKPRLIIIDYLQLAKSGSKTDNRVNEVSAIARGMKLLTLSTGIPIIALAQLSRAVEQREDKRPMLADLRESGDIEAAADIVAFLYRPSYYDANLANAMSQTGYLPGGAKIQPTDMTELILGKHRKGKKGVVKLGFQAELSRFVNLDNPAGYGY